MFGNWNQKLKFEWLNQFVTHNFGNLEARNSFFNMFYDFSLSHAPIAHLLYDALYILDTWRCALLRRRTGWSRLWRALTTCRFILNLGSFCHEIIQLILPCVDTFIAHLLKPNVCECFDLKYKQIFWINQFSKENLKFERIFAILEVWARKKWFLQRVLWFFPRPYRDRASFVWCVLHLG